MRTTPPRSSLLQALMAAVAVAQGRSVFRPFSAPHATPARTPHRRAAGAFGRGLARAQAACNRRLIETYRLGPKLQLRDTHGCFTLTGRGPQGDRYMWLAGISAQRGY
ncbi:MAG: hypothetical protein RLZZ524_2357 [Pseudomonadota bacterium]|jgi:hypothetical protein